MQSKNYSLSLFLTIFITSGIFAGTPIIIPVITTFAPQSGPVGTSVTIKGSNFNPVLSANIVYFGATLATVTAATDSTLKVTSPAGASFQQITVLNISTGLVGYSSKPFITTNSTTSFTFKPKVDSGTGNNPKMIAAGDFDNDGKPDLVVTNSNSNTISIYANACSTGTVNLKLPIILATDLNPGSVVVGDLNGDGKLDIAVVNQGSSSVWVYQNNSTAPGIISFAAPIVLVSSVSPKSIIITDLDGDGKADIVAALDTTKSIDIFKNQSNTGTIAFTVKRTMGIGTPAKGLVACDLNNDGLPEVIVTIGNSIGVLINNSVQGSISFSGILYPPAGTIAQEVATGDIDGDGKIDLVVSNSGSNNVSVFINTSVIKGAVSLALQKFFPVGTNPFGLAINDINGDGLPDIVTANFGSNNISVLINITTTAGAPAFNARINQACGTAPSSLVALDMDGDGRPDVATANSMANSLSAILNTFYVLAVDALYFSATKTADGVQLNWKSYSELTTRYFYIQKSLDGIHFNTIDSIANTATFNLVKNFTYTDKFPADGFNFYRLTTIDVDGNIKLSNVSVINLLRISTTKVSIYPTPVINIATVNITGNIGNRIFSIFDANGRIIKTYPIADGESFIKIDRNNMPAGIYFYQLTSTGGTIKKIGEFMTR